MNWYYWTWQLLALLIWREASDQGEEGMRAVGHVAYNRHKRDNRDLCAVIVQESQFTSINPPGHSYDPGLERWPTKSDPSFTKAQSIAGAILGETDPDLTGGAYYYWNPKISKADSWYARNIAGGQKPHKLLATIGQHEFHSFEEA